ncbi:hypothetical protein ACE102_47515 (plasmid) [Bradyrhizobium sp. vgs-9]|jgi:hypothetical protein|uniref:hypothetical protein n=1 Tax=Bradyrhizobium sp. vgs-9 TaxID=208389 RepID=UPI0035D435C7
MIRRRNSDAEAAAQYLTWALEEIERLASPNAAHHARIALEEVRRDYPSADPTNEHSIKYAEEARRFRDKADEAEQLVEMVTPVRREALMSIVENYRRKADQMDRLAAGQNNTTFAANTDHAH